MGLSEGQLASLRALADAFCPACEETDGAKAWRGTRKRCDRLWQTSAASLPILIAKLVRTRMQQHSRDAWVVGMQYSIHIRAVAVNLTPPLPHTSF